jgi:glycosyltransferase involved in cell wall biosynthesis
MNSIAICIPTYNQASYLDGAVRSALAQTYPCEIWVSDDASTDETPAVMAHLLQEHPHIRHTRQKRNLGMSGNPRWIVRQPMAEYVVKLDSDDELHPDYVEKLLKILLKHPNAGYAHAAVQEITGTGQKQKLRLLARKTGFQPGEESLRTSVSGYRVAANICMFRREALKQVDYYRNDLKFADDWDLAVRLADADWGNVYVNEVLASYRVWDTSNNLRSRRKLMEIDGSCRVIEESLIPAFTRHNWSLTPIMKARRRFALRHAVCLRLPHFTEIERTELRNALCRLGDSPALRWKFRWIRTPLFPLIKLPAAFVAHAKGLCKSLLFKTNR